MNGKQVKRIRRLVRRFAQSKNDMTYMRRSLKQDGYEDTRILTKTSEKYMVRKIKRLMQHTPWNLRHMVLPQLRLDSQDF